MAGFLGGLGLVGAAACSTGPDVCSTVACPDGLNIVIEGNLQPGMSYEVEVSTETPLPETVPIMRCTLTVDGRGGRALRCSSELRHSESDGIHFVDRLPSVHVRVSKATTTLAEQSFTPMYVTREPNGPGCGTCTSAAVTISVP